MVIRENVVEDYFSFFKKKKKGIDFKVTLLWFQIRKKKKLNIYVVNKIVL